MGGCVTPERGSGGEEGDETGEAARGEGEFEERAGLEFDRDHGEGRRDGEPFTGVRPAGAVHPYRGGGECDARPRPRDPAPTENAHLGARVAGPEPRRQPGHLTAHEPQGTLEAAGPGEAEV